MNTDDLLSFQNVTPIFASLPRLTLYANPLLMRYGRLRQRFISLLTVGVSNQCVIQKLLKNCLFPIFKLVS